MKSKKFWAILIAVIMLMLALVACNPTPPDNNNGDDPSNNVVGGQEDGKDDDGDNNGPDAVLSEAYAWIAELKLEDIVQVYYESGGIGVAPGSSVYYAYSKNSTDIANTFALLSCKLTAISKYEGQIDGGSYVRYTFYTASGETYSISVSNSIVTINGYYYRVESFKYTFQHAYSSGDKNAPVEDEANGPVEDLAE